MSGKFMQNTWKGTTKVSLIGFLSPLQIVEIIHFEGRKHSGSGSVVYFGPVVAQQLMARILGRGIAHLMEARKQKRKQGR